MPIWDGAIPPADQARMERFLSGKRRSRVPGARPALLIVDMNLRFTTDDYTSGSTEVGGEVIRHLRPLLQKARGAGIPVIFTSTQPRVTPAEQGQWGGSTPANGAADPRSGEIHPDLKPQAGEEVVWKIPPSGFFNTELISLLTHYQVDTVIATGISTSGCVRATVVDAFSYNFTVIVPEECCGDRSQISHQINLFDMHCKYAEVQPVAETLAYLERVAPNPRKAGTAHPAG